jgi:hypothetical protein
MGMEHGTLLARFLHDSSLSFRRRSRKGDY